MRSDMQPAVEGRDDELLEYDMTAIPPGERRYCGTIKWFDQTRGFGFMVCDDPEVGDVMVHFSVLQPHDCRSLPEGARIECHAMARNRGLQATEILAIDLTHAVQMPERRAADDRIDPAALIDSAGPYEGVMVKWFNRLKGYGFLVRDSDAADIFVHMETLRKAGVIEIDPELKLRARIVDGRKGPLAVEVEMVA